MSVPGIFARGSIKTRVTLFTLGIFLLCTWLLALYASRVLHEDMEKLLGEQQFSLVTLAAEEINEELEDRFQALKMVGATITPAHLANTTALQQLLEQHVVFQQLFNGGTTVTGLDGTTLTSLPYAAERTGVNYMDRDFMAAALKDGRASIGRPVMGKKRQVPLFAMAVPLRNAQGMVIGALVGVTDLNKPTFLDKITKQHSAHDASYFLSTPQHRLVLAATDTSRIMQALPAPGVSPMLDRYWQGYEGHSVFTNTKGVEVLTAAKGIPAAGWVLTVSLPTEQIFSPVATLQRRLLWAVLLMTLLAGALTWWMLRRQLAPLFGAIQILSDIPGTSAFPRHLPIARQDEIGALFGTFNRLLEAADRREYALRESKMRFRNLIDNNNAIILQIDAASGEILDANATACKFYGWSHAHLCTMTLQDIQATDLLAMPANERNPLAFQHRLANGETRTVEVHTTPVHAGERTQLISIVHDITQRTRNEQRFYRLMHEQTAIINSRIVGIVKLNDRKVVWGNAAIAEMLGYTLEELVGQPTRIVYPSDQAYRAFAELAHPAMQRGEVFRAEMQYRRKDDSLGWYDVGGSLLDPHNNESIWAFVDISARKQAQAELVTARAQAEQANRAKSRFLAAASHDLRQPLSALSMYVGVLEGRIQPEHSKLVAKIKACSDSLTGMLTDLLDVSTLDAGGVTPRPVDFVVDDFLAALVSVHSAEAHAKGLRLHLRPCGAVSARTDPHLLNRIVNNLLANAIRYTDSGGVLLACRRHEGALWIEVWDTGMGIPDDKTDLIFEEFTQIGDGPRNRGTGLGLAIVAKTASLLGLRIRMRSQLGRGSLFAIELPAGQANTHTESPPPPLTPTQPRHIGLVENHADVRHAMVMALENFGHEVVAAADSQALLQRLGARTPDIVIADHRREGHETGDQVVEALRRVFGAGLPAIVLTGDSDPALIRSLAAQDIAVHSKPLAMDRLQAFITQATERTST